MLRSADRVSAIVGEDPLERAQAGDVLGIEHEGETTSLGDTARDEIGRRDDELNDAEKQRRDELTEGGSRLVGAVREPPLLRLMAADG